MSDTIFGHYVPCSHLAILATFSLKYQFDIMPLLKRHQLSKKLIYTPDAVVAASVYTDILVAIDEQLQVPELWFEFGKLLGFPSHGVLGQAVQSCDDLGQSLALLAHYYPILSCGSALRLNQLGDDLALHILRQGDVSARKNILKVELLTGVITHSIAPFLCAIGDQITVELDYAAPENHALYNRYLNARIKFACPQARLLVPPSIQRVPCPYANPVMLEILTQQCQLQTEHLAQQKTTMAKVRSLIAAVPGHYPSIDNVATQLGTSSRTLSRRLNENGSNFNMVTNEVKSQQAVQYLQVSQLSVEEVAERIGFNNSANFRRAFSGWTGVSPSEFRKQCRFDQ